MMARCCLLGAFAISIMGQTPPYNFTYVPPGSLFGNSGAPYSADEIHEHSKPDATGKLIAEPAEVRHVYRDSQGRKRTEIPVSQSKLSVVEIEDPVAGFKIVLDPQARIAHRLKVARSQVSPLTGSALLSRPVGSDQPLGTQTIGGLLAVGTRSVVNLEHGASTIDTWTIPELSVIGLVKNTLPRMGVFTTRLEHIRRAEPDAFLFLIPPEYGVSEESGTFSFAIRRP